jgi:putative transferase (TIGR04331 family)
MRVLDPSLPAKAYMGRAKLVIVEGMSTSLFESLASNIPTIAFWPAELYHLGAEFEDYYSVLEEVGVVVHDPLELARQVRRVQQDPHAWWFKHDIQAARARFMDQNLHDNTQAEKVLLGMIRDRQTKPLRAGGGV